jgi:hypothetical protein
VGFICLTIAFIFHTIREAFLKNALLKEASLLHSQIANARKLLGDFEEEPQNLLGAGLENLGLGSMLQNLNITDDMLKSVGVPGWALPLIHGFLDKMKQKQGENGAQSTFKGQAEP